MQKFLDADGVQTIWKKIIEQGDYLANIINIIDEEKADKLQLQDYLLKSEYNGNSSTTLNTEDWTFTLVDGTTITKKVVIG
jgi:hypothetical protein